MKYNLEIGSSYNFVFNAPSVLGNSLERATVLSLMDFESAVSVDNVVAKHAAVYSELPSGTPVNAKDLLYFKVRSSTGKSEIYAMDWLAATPVLVVNKTVNVTITQMDLSKIPLLREALSNNGFSNFSINAM